MVSIFGRSDIPIGTGLSSSVALEIATLRALRVAFELDVSDVVLAQTAQRAEVESWGAGRNHGSDGVQSRLRTRGAVSRYALSVFRTDRIPPRLDLVVLDSGVAHQHAGGDDLTRPREADEAARQLGVTRLRDLSVG
jgi:galactokinase